VARDENENGLLVAVFPTVHHVMAAERAFERAGVPCDLIPMPRELSADCGMALAFRPVELDAARPLLRRAELRLHALYARDGERWTARPV